ncbi:50S ribosomal protein L10 [Coxiella-like endosymbiont of Rhipicephalus sanguineus]|uniref:50S ribosomal protein L10 n=1 Tax=Coxiella-like endosymbiont of Rhipicephalus sanguineus TaxID=1955402 RepID=UPI00203D20A2|nr:50S ribosomal protein L10 [Coxiella-like endosymbiont of Rhipicephalus sanguineus]MBT8506244.1 50S ribosomal protein L10 [Coxiella-like endosymbiont of Rhipicephalus sanguineus]
MALNLEQKKAIVAELLDIAQQAISVVVADYRGLTVSEMSELRKTARNAGVTMRVYRNTLARRAFKETPYACLDKILTGPIVLFFSQQEPGAAARLIEKFIKEHEQLEVKALAFGAELLSADKLKAVAQLPSREEALSQLVAVLLAPVTKFLRTLNEPVTQVVRVVAAIQDQKKAA